MDFFSTQYSQLSMLDQGNAQDDHSQDYHEHPIDAASAASAATSAGP